MLFSDSCRFLVVLGGSWWFLVVHGFLLSLVLVVLGVFWCFFVIIGCSLRLLVDLGGSWWFLGVLGGSW